MLRTSTHAALDINFKYLNPLEVRQLIFKMHYNFLLIKTDVVTVTIRYKSNMGPELCYAMA